MRILLFGREGKIGWELQRSLAPLGEILAPGHGDVHPHCGDLANLESLGDTVRRTRPDMIVNAAAYTAVDKAESEPDAAWAVNSLGPERLAFEAASLGALLVHFSTDCVFDGSGSNPWYEDSPTGPINAYGRSKLEGEERIRATGCSHLVLRTSWIHAGRRESFARMVLRLAAERESIEVVEDQIGSPTGAALVADATARAARATLAKRNLGGTYHCVASGYVSRFEYAKFVVSSATAMGETLKLGLDHIRPVKSEYFRSPARRPLNTRLATGKFCDAFGLIMPDWQIGLKRTLTELVEVARASGR